MNYKENNIITYLLLIIFSIFISFSNSLFQVSIDSGLALSNIIKYPEPFSPMKYYFFNSWTLINQLSETLLRIGFSVENSSRFILFLSSFCFSASSFLIVNRITQNKFLAIAISVLMMVFQKNLGDTDYPSLVISNHTYGMMSLALTSLIISLVLNNFYKLSGFFSTLLIGVHPVIGIWIISIMIFSSVIFKEKKLNSFFLKGGIYGLFITLVSLILFLLKSIGTFDFNIENLNSYMRNWDGHRNMLGIIHFEYLFKTFVLFIIINVYFYIKDKKTSFFKIFFNTVLILSTLIYFLFKLVPGIFPELIIKASPTRFIILHSFVAWPLILSIIYFLISKLKNTKKISIITLSIVLITYSIQHNKNFVNLKNNFFTNMFNKDTDLDTKFFNDLSVLNTTTYFITTSQTTHHTHALGLKPILLDTRSFDFIPYHPYLVDNVYEILQKVYGVELNTPPIKNNPYIPDSFIQKSFEKKSKQEWISLSKKYNAGYIAVPSDWVINLDLLKKNNSFAIYEIK